MARPASSPACRTFLSSAASNSWPLGFSVTRCAIPLLFCRTGFLLHDAERFPIGGLRHNALERREVHMLHRALCRPPFGSYGGTALAELFSGGDHHAAELNHGKVAGAGMIFAAIRNWPHGLPHRHVLGR